MSKIIKNMEDIRLHKVCVLLSKAKSQAKYYDQEYQEKLEKEASELSFRYEKLILNDNCTETEAGDELYTEYSKIVDQLLKEYRKRESEKRYKYDEMKHRESRDLYDKIKEQKSKKQQRLMQEDGKYYEMEELSEELYCEVRYYDESKEPELQSKLKEFKDKIDNLVNPKSKNYFQKRYDAIIVGFKRKNALLTRKFEPRKEVTSFNEQIKQISQKKDELHRQKYMEAAKLRNFDHENRLKLKKEEEEFYEKFYEKKTKRKN